MCGRYSLGLPRPSIRHVVGDASDASDEDLEWIDEDAFTPRHNIAPRSYAPVLRRRNATDGRLSDKASNVPYVIQTMKWGLVPHWSKHEDKSLNTTNARMENLVGFESGTMWNSIKGKNRCAVICEGYFEWLKKGKDRLPHFTKHAEQGKPMFLAGLYDCTVLEGESKPLYTFTIVTTEANEEFMWLHDRQPVILSSKATLDAWLDTSSRTWTQKLTEIVNYPVPKEVGKVGTESDSFIRPISQRKDGIEAMFAKAKAKSPRKITSASGDGRSFNAEPSSSAPATPIKVTSHKRPRSHSSSPSPVKTVDELESEEKVEKLIAWDDSGQVEYIDEKPVPEAKSLPPVPLTPTKKPRKSGATPSPRKKAKKDVTASSDGVPKITQFFKKA
ncbi:DUF159-domain-containing protein [Punctularia strigosozonata HHB-11173 SS5]|uniref:DUF159-domain-containing protein n=1 Tax=Punctularia strigosozonata (strain HHB-11173) TaxID=741275 RepID=UPI00044163E4|nr:DUF159-domain-containing protein [Punctularia strigosozonata HHB-11173 SS5]EIN05900.1 DUF159-domain-containing protein [Punctularia strigosozonata HHB-11173 SS5]